jgi:thiol-disulfide isomerase/thioredoxin
MKQIPIILTTLICVYGSVQAQQKKLQVGDTLPGMVLTNLLNYPAKEIRLPDHSGKWLILDLWTTGCGACVEAFPKIKQLQNEFAGKVDWLLVTTQPKEEIIHFVQKRKILTGLGMSLPVVCGDSLLNNYFQPDGYPHCVWIDGTDVIRSVTAGREVTEFNIQAILQNRNFQMDQKDDSSILVDYDKPLFINNNAGDGRQLMWSTTLSKYIKGLPPINSVYYTDSGYTAINSFNQTIKWLYQHAFNDDEGFGDFYAITDSRTEFNIKDTTKYVYYINGNVQYENFYCYQAILPKLPYHELKSIMQGDLRKYFGLNARMEKRNRLCWVLSARDTIMFKSKGGKSHADWDGVNYTKTYSNCSFDQVRAFVEYVLLLQSPYPFLNEIHCKEMVDITLVDLKEDDPDSAIRALAKYGISLKLENRTIDVLVIYEQ